MRRSLRSPAVVSAVLGLVVALCSGASAGAATAAGAPATATTATPTYYVSLGDSLASGFQPDTGTETDQAYPDRVFAQLKKSDPNLRHIRLGCTGETTQTMIDGGLCVYLDRSGATVPQLAKAVDFLAQNGSRVRYLSLNIGGNDIGGCATDTGIDTACSLAALKKVDTNVNRIATALNSAASASTSLAGANSFNPFLAAWLAGPAGQTTAFQSTGVQTAFNDVVTRRLTQQHFDIADFASAFSSTSFLPEVDAPGLGKVPTNVARLCALTFTCGPLRDIHPNTSGHDLLAQAFLPVL
ncbi:SGNH/GDSL hydrolase family protein [Streptomyces sp. NPDC001941]|uniref:SGNH/GDSL hydrolase family protein n=1 Tax=Streptomyces sp. NPDC001941 TaxID=3154659 RepID=UPI00332AA28A